MRLSTNPTGVGWEGEANTEPLPEPAEGLRPLFGRHWRGFQLLSRETNPRLYAQGLMHLARRMEDDDCLDGATYLYSELVAPVGAIPRERDRHELPLQEVPGTIRDEARSRLAVINGTGGSTAERWAFVGRRLVSSTFEPSSLAAMIGAGFLSRGMTLWSRRFLTEGGHLLWTGRIGANFISRTAGFVGEVGGFTLIGKGMRTALGRTEDWSFNALSRELRDSALLFGAMRATGFGVRSYLGYTEATFSTSPFQVRLLHQFGMLAAIMGTRAIEAHLGWREGSDDFAYALADGIATLVQFNFAGLVAQRVMGARLRAAETAMDLELQRLDRMDSVWLPDAAVAGLGGGALHSSRWDWERPELPPQATTITGGDGMGGGGGGSFEGGPPGLRIFLNEVAERGKSAELRQMVEIMHAIATEGDWAPRSDNLVRYYQERNAEQWRIYIRVVGEMLLRRPEAIRSLLGHADYGQFHQRWVTRPHFLNAEEVPLDRMPGFRYNPSNSLVLREVTRSLFHSPDLMTFQDAVQRLGRDDRHPLRRKIELPNGDRVWAGNVRQMRLIARFNREGALLPPLRVGPRFTPKELESFVPEVGSVSPSPTLQPGTSLKRFIRAPGETPTLFAMRLLERSREVSREGQLELARTLLDGLSNPETEIFFQNVAERLESLTGSLPEGSSILVRSYRLPGFDTPLRIVSLPSTFLPEHWSQTFAEGMLYDFLVSRRPVERAVEVGSGTGWMALIMAKRGIAREVIGLDKNPDAALVGELNARLNGVTGVRFLESDAFSALPDSLKADLIVACIPQVPSAEPLDARRTADYYESRGDYWDRFGLGLVSRVLSDSHRYLATPGRVLFNLAGRPGRATLEAMMADRGFRSTVRFAKLIPQDTGTDFSSLALRERETGQHFEFFLEDPSRPISAGEAVGKKGVLHNLYLMEGRPFREVFRDALPVVYASAGILRYTPDSGSEHGELRELATQYLSNEMGVQVDPAGVFVGPGLAVMVRNAVNVLVPPGRAVAWVGGEEALQNEVAAALPERRHLRTPFSLEGLFNATAEDPGAVVFRFAREHWDQAPDILHWVQQLSARGITSIVAAPYFPQSRGGANPLVEFLAQNPELAARVVLLQSLDQGFHISEAPLTLGVVPNQHFYQILAREGEVTYSRVSTAVQELYRAFLEGLVVARHGVPPTSRMLAASPGFSPPRSPVIAALSSPKIFAASPTGAHSDPIDMSFGESEFVPRLDLGSTVVRALRRGDFAALEREARESMVRYIAESRGIVFQPEQLVLTSGVHPGLVLATQAIGMREAGFPLSVLVPEPSYGLYFPTIASAGAEVLPVPTLFKGRFLVEESAIPRHGASRRGKNPLALLLNSPTNPAGQYYPMERLTRVARHLKSSGGFLFWDDVFGMLDLQPRPAVPQGQLVELHRLMGDRLVVFGGLSKEFAAGGLRVGYVASTNQALITEVGRRRLAAPDPMALAVTPTLTENWEGLLAQHRDYLLHRRGVLLELFRDHGIQFHEPQGGYSLFANLSPLDGRFVSNGGGRREEITRESLPNLLYTRAGIRIHGDTWAGVPHFYRFVYSIDRIEEAAARLKRFFRGAH